MEVKMPVFDFLKYYAALVGVAAGAILGPMDGLFIALIIFIVMDYLTGVMVAILEKRLSSEIGFKGICKKILIFVLVALANIIDVYVMKCGAAVRTSVIFFYLANEGISILENVSKTGLPVPEKLRKILDQLNEEDVDE